MFGSRERAQAAILEGRVYVDGRPALKAGQLVAADSVLELKGPDFPYVGRGGLKLQRALEAFRLCPSGMVVVDVGASTGGFTDCLLQNGAKKVYAVDVGYGLIAPKLRSDSRVVVLERTNARYLNREHVPEGADLATVDVSFISALKILPALHNVLSPGAEILVLVKPQFEAGRHLVRRGVVRDPQVHRQVLQDFVEGAADAGFRVVDVTYSWPPGPSGNLEFWVRMIREGEGREAGVGDPSVERRRIEERIEQAVAAGHEAARSRGPEPA